MNCDFFCTQNDLLAFFSLTRSLGSHAGREDVGVEAGGFVQLQEHQVVDLPCETKLHEAKES